MRSLLVGATLGAGVWLAAMILWGVSQDPVARASVGYVSGFAQGFVGGYLSTPGGFTFTALAALIGAVAYRRRAR